MNIIKYPNLFFTSDKHLGHEFMVKGMRDKEGNLLPGAHIPRPMFSSVEEMDEAIIERNNERVKKGDLVYDLGDHFLKITQEKAREYQRRLVGNRYGLKGNHDKTATSLASTFVWYRSLEEITLGQPYFNADERQMIVLCHYSMRVWRNSHRGSWMLYGHSHGMLPELPELLSFDIGVDCWNFYPVSIEEVKAKMAQKMPAWLQHKESLKGTGRVE